MHGAPAVGVLGLGRMGGAIARRILSAGYRVYGYDVRREACEALAADGGVQCPSAAAVAAASELVVSSLPGPREVDEAMRGSNGALQALRPEAIVVETSTISALQSRQLAAEIAACSAHYLDAPVSGGVEAAEAGSLAIMVGGSAAALERARPVLECFGKRIFHVGPTGGGNTMKLVIQAIFLSQVAAFLEGVALGERSGIPMERVLEVLAASAAHHPVIAHRYGKLLTDDLAPRFEVRAAIKDLDLVQGWSREMNFPATVTVAVAAAYARAAEAGWADKDLIALCKVYERASDRI